MIQREQVNTKLSVCIPTWNRAEKTMTAINSVLKNTHDFDVEIVVCDNASTDNTEKMVREIASITPNVKYFRNTRNIGPELNFIRVIEHAGGEYCWLLGSDDAITPDSIPSIINAMNYEADLIMGEFINCDKDLNANGIIKLLTLSETFFNFSDRKDILTFLNNATIHASLFGYISSMVFKRDRWLKIPVNKDFIGSGYMQVSRALDILVKGSGRLHYLSKAIVNNRRAEDDYVAEFGSVERHLLDLRMYHLALVDYFSSDLEIRNAFKEYVRRCYGAVMRESVTIGIASIDKFINYFRHDDAELPIIQRQLRPKVEYAISRFQINGLFDRLFSVDSILHLGYRGNSRGSTLPINHNTIGVELGYPGYNGIILPFENETQDCIWVSYCLPKISEPVSAIREWFRVLKPGGFLVISCSLVDSLPESPISNSTVNQSSGLNLSAFWKLINEAFNIGNCRIIHCAQTEPNKKLANESELLFSDIDLVLQKLISDSDLSSNSLTSHAYSSQVNEVLSPEMLLPVAMEHHQNGRLDEAEKVYRQILDSQPDTFAAIHMLGVVYFQRGELVQAESLLKQAIEINAGMAEVHYNLGCVLKATRRFEEARNSFMRALSQNPAFEKAQVRLIELRQFLLN